MKSLYVIIDACTVCIPLVFSFHKKLQFNKNFKAFFAANFMVAFVFIIWDMAFTKLGVWGFNPDYITGFYVYNLPIEELLFFVCIPFACVFTYHCLNLFFNYTWKPKTEVICMNSLAFLLMIIGFYCYDKLYTSSTFISLSIIIFALKYVAKVKWLAKLFLIYPVLLIPFFIVNGILTGSGLQQPVVWYNNAETMGIRLFTIPIEDVFYGFELILLHVFFYEYFKNKTN